MHRLYPICYGKAILSIFNWSIFSSKIVIYGQKKKAHFMVKLTRSEFKNIEGYSCL